MKKLKNKILLGLIFLLIVIILLSLTGILSIYFLSKDSDAIIRDNYASVKYANNMLDDLEDIFTTQILIYTVVTDPLSIAALKQSSRSKVFHFEEILETQSHNITEPGENKIVEKVREYSLDLFSFIDSGGRTKLKLSDIEVLKSKYERTAGSVKEIYNLNMSAIIHKNSKAHETADKVSLYMSLTAAASVLLTLIFISYFPGYISSPIMELTKKIEDISNKKYDQRLNIQSKDELSKLATAFNKMAVKLKEFETKHTGELLLEKRRMETLVINLQDGTLLLDNNFNILHVNYKFCELTGLSINNILGKNIAELGNDNEILAGIRSLDLRQGQALPSEKIKPIRMIIDKQTRYFQILILAIRKELKLEFSNDPSGYILLVQNITRYEERDLAKTDLISTISHELKTPLSSINLSIKLLEDERIGALNDDQKGFIQSIKLHSQRILNLVNEVLDYTQAETGHIKLKIEQCKINDIIELGTFAILMLLNEKEIDLNLSVPEKLPDVKCDLEKTVWVMVNLLNNAIRYSSPGGKITIQAQEEKNFVSISVRDDGPGITPEDQKRIFNKYVKAKSDSTKGTGLGLAIAKEFVEEQRGQIGVESTPGSGSKFYFSLPSV